MSNEGATVLLESFARERNGVWLDDVECAGTESRLIDCPASGIPVCSHDRVAGVQCASCNQEAVSQGHVGAPVITNVVRYHSNSAFIGVEVSLGAVLSEHGYFELNLYYYNSGDQNIDIQVLLRISLCYMLVSLANT